MRLNPDPYANTIDPHRSYDAKNLSVFHGKNKSMLNLSREAVAMGLDKSMLAK